MKKLIAITVLVVLYILFIRSWTDQDLLTGEWKSTEPKIEMIFRPDNTYTITTLESKKSGRFDLKRNFLGARWIDLKGAVIHNNLYPDVISNDYQVSIKNLKQDSLNILFGQSQITKPYSTHMILVK